MHRTILLNSIGVTGKVHMVLTKAHQETYKGAKQVLCECFDLPSSRLATFPLSLQEFRGVRLKGQGPSVKVGDVVILQDENARRIL